MLVRLLIAVVHTSPSTKESVLRNVTSLTVLTTAQRSVKVTGLVQTAKVCNGTDISDMINHNTLLYSDRMFS